MSVAFRAAVREVDDNGVTHVVKGDLINCTITGIPANLSTTVSAKVGARNSSKDAERIQSMHDHAVELGATCSEKCAHGFQSGGVIPSGKPESILIGEQSREIVIDGRKFKEWLVDYSREAGGVPITARDAKKSTDTETPTAPGDPAPVGAQVEVVRALAQLALTRAALALE
jgi:hypothetical protein